MTSRDLVLMAGITAVLASEAMPLGFEVGNGPVAYRFGHPHFRNESAVDGLNPFPLRSCVCVWDSRFAEPIELPGGVKLTSLREAIVHLVNTVAAAERRMSVVLIAAELITSAAEHGGPIEFARIATLRAINRHPVRVPNHSRRDPNGVSEN
jgi:hypothetical protein